MRAVLTFLVLLAPAWGVAGPAEVPSGRPGPDPLATVRPGHPRLLLPDAELAAAKEAAKRDTLRATLHAHIIEVARRQLDAPPLEHKLVGPRLLDQSRKAIAYVLTNAMAFRLTGEARYAERAKRDMLTAAAMPDWNPSHFLDVAEMSFALAIGYDWLHAQLAPAERVIIKRALVEKALSFAAAAYQPGNKPDKRLTFPSTHHNWNQVCNGGLLAAALALADEEPALARTVIAGVRESLPRAMAAYSPDGAYPEGPAYWTYGTTYNVLILALLQGTLGQDFGLGFDAGFACTARYRVAVQSPTGLAFNYADGSTALGASPALSWLATRSGQAGELAFSRTLLDAAFAKNFSESNDRFVALNAVWFPAGSSGQPDVVEGIPLDLQFRGPAQLAIFRSAWNDPLALFVGFKAGSNKVNHAHLDLGSFVFDSDGVRWAHDLGPDDYNLPGYFGAQRWGYYRLNNRSHNVIQPLDDLQDPAADAPIIAFQSNPDLAFAVADLTKAFPGRTKRIWRGIAVLNRSRVLVQDEIEDMKGGTLTWRMMTSGTKAQLTGAHDLRLEHESRRSLHLRILEPSSASFVIRPARDTKPGENRNKGVLEIGVELGGINSNARLVVVLTPTSSHWPSTQPRPVIKPLAEW